MSPVIIGFRIDFLAETGTKYTITAWSTVFSFPPFFLFSSFLLLMLPCISLCFLSPPRGPYAGIFLSFVLLRPCSSYMSLIGSVCFPYIIRVLIAPLFILLRLAYQVFCFISRLVLIFWFFLWCCVLFYPVRCHFTCLTHELAVIFVFGLPLSNTQQSVTPLQRSSTSQGQGMKTDTGCTRYWWSLVEVTRTAVPYVGTN